MLKCQNNLLKGEHERKPVKRKVAKVFNFNLFQNKAGSTLAETGLNWPYDRAFAAVF
jgi:hypothetical protein